MALEIYYQDDNAIICLPGWGVVAEITDWVVREKPEMVPVLAAASDLLAACEEALKELKYHNWQNTSTYNQIQAAIAKAKGSPAL